MPKKCLILKSRIFLFCIWLSEVNVNINIDSKWLLWKFGWNDEQELILRIKQLNEEEELIMKMIEDNDPWRNHYRQKGFFIIWYFKVADILYTFFNKNQVKWLQSSLFFILILFHFVILIIFFFRFTPLVLKGIFKFRENQSRSFFEFFPATQTCLEKQILVEEDLRI